MKIWITLILVAFSPLVGGCQEAPKQRHDWILQPEREANWEQLPASRVINLAWESPAELATFSARLAETSVVPLSKSEFESIIHGAKPKSPREIAPPVAAGAITPPTQLSALHPYLVRGLAFGRGGNAEVWQDPLTHEIWVHHATWNGESMFGVFATRELEECPVIVMLDAPPTKVYVTAIVGGDSVFRRRHGAPPPVH